MSDGVWRPVIHEVSLSVGKGRVLGVVGESGSGKTVSSLACMGLLPIEISRIDRGRCIFDNRIELLGNGFEGARSVRGSGIAMVFQEPMSSLNPAMRCGEQVAEMYRLHHRASKHEVHKAVVDRFTEVELPDPEGMIRRYPHELSGGQKQRVMIAMALAADPALIIADEPTTALDVTVQANILKLLKRLQRNRGLSMIFISHDLDVVARIADDVVVMWNGRVVEAGTVNAVLEHPQHAYTQGLLNCKPPIGGARVRLPTVADTLESRVPEPRTFSLSVSEKPIIEVRNVHKSFVTKRNVFGKPTRLFQAVRGVSFDVFKGETLGIVGESGCGKSTLSRIIMGLLVADNGEVRIHRERQSVAPAVQLVFQDPFSSLNPRITAVGCLIEALRVSGTARNTDEARQKALALMHEVGLSDADANRYPHAFSGGQRQRLVIARSLCTEPEVLILDESVAALDISVQAQVLNLLNRLKEERRLTYLFISHDLRVVQYMSDRILVMFKGQIEELGTTASVIQNPQSPYTKQLLSSLSMSG